MRNREALPQLDAGLFLTDGGIETVVILSTCRPSRRSTCSRTRPARRCCAATTPTNSRRSTAASEAGLPVVISFTLETDGRLASGQPLAEAIELDEGDPADLAARYAELTELLPRLNVMGGCCGADHRHVAATANAVA